MMILGLGMCLIGAFLYYVLLKSASRYHSGVFITKEEAEYLKTLAIAQEMGLGVETRSRLHHSYYGWKRYCKLVTKEVYRASTAVLRMDITRKMEEL